MGSNPQVLWDSEQEEVNTLKKIALRDISFINPLAIIGSPAPWCCSMPSILSYNPLTKCVAPHEPKQRSYTMLSWCQKIIIKTMTLKRFNQVQELPLPTALKLMLGTLSLQDFLIDADQIPPDGHDTQIFPATCLLTDSPVNIKLVPSSDDIDQNDPTFLATFKEEDQIFVVEELTKPLSELIEECKNSAKAFDIEIIWLALDRLVQHLIDKDVHPTTHISCNSVHLLPNNQVLIQIRAPADSGTQCMRKASDAVYEAPEVLNMNNPDSRALVWSIGCILYEMLALEPAYCDRKGVNIFQVLMRVTNGEIPMFPSTGSEVLKSLLRKCLVADPASRISLQKIKVLTSSHGQCST